MSERERDPMDNLRDLIDEPVAPRTAFADELRSRLMRELSASDASREEHSQPMDAISAPRPLLAFPIESPRRIRPMAILELAAAAIIILGLAAALGRGWFENDPEPLTSVPAAALQGDETPTPAPATEQTPVEQSTVFPTVAPDGAIPTENPNDQVPTISPGGSIEPTVVPPGNSPNTIWALPGDGGIVNFGGMLVENGVVYRLIATPNFVGIQAIDGATGAVVWQQARQWTGNLFAIDTDMLFLDGGNTTLVAVNAETGADAWTGQVPGNPIAIAADDEHVFVLLDSDVVAALDRTTGEQQWVAQGAIPTNPTGGSTRIPANGTIAVTGNTVAAISTYGVLSGFDVATGEERWSHDGYDTSSVIIGVEDGRFIVTSGGGLISMTARVGSVSTPDDSGECGMYFVGSDGSDSSNGTPEAGASPVAVPGTTFGAESIDPVTGEIIWSQHVITGDDAAAIAGANASNPVACVIDSETGQIGVDTTGQAAITVSEGSDGLFSATQGVAVGNVSTVAIGTFRDASQQPLVAIAEDGAVYVQLTDGSLVKVAVDRSTEEDEHDNSNVSTESTPADD